jgi:hypothetical protein
MAYGDPRPGGAGTVQGGDPGFEADKEGLAGAWQQVVGRARKPQGPNAAAYDEQMNRAAGNAIHYGNVADNYTQATPEIQNQYQEQSREDVRGNVMQQNYLAGHLRDIMEGKDVTGSKAQIQAGTDAAIAAQQNMARSAKGGAVAQAGAARAGQQQAAVSQAGVANQAAQLQAQLASQAQGQAAQVYSNIGQQEMAQYTLEQQSAIKQAELQGASQAQINQMKLGFGALGNQAQGLSQAALNQYTQGILQAQGLGQSGAAADAASQNQLIGTAAGVAGAAMMASDINAKTQVHQEGFRQGMQAGRTTALDYQNGTVGQNAQIPKGEPPTYGRDVYGGADGQGPAPYQGQAPQSETAWSPPSSSYAAALSPASMAPVPSSPAYQQVAQPALAELPQVRSSAAQMSQASEKASPAASAALPGPQASQAAQAQSAASQVQPRAQAGLASFMSDEASKILAESESSSADALKESQVPYKQNPLDLSGFQKDTFKDTYGKLTGGKKKKGGTDVDAVAAGEGDTTLPDYDAGPVAANPNAPAWLNQAQGMAGGVQSGPSPADQIDPSVTAATAGYTPQAAYAAPAAEAAAFESDERAKNVDRKHTLADDFLDGMHPLSFHYKQLQDEPVPHPHGGKYLGITAQDLERIPEVGPQLVENTPRGKQVLIKPTLSAALAGLARMNERVRHLEGKGK